MNEFESLMDVLAEAVAKRLQPPAGEELPLFWSVKEAQEKTGLSRDTIYELIHSGEFRAIREHPENPRSKLLIDPDSVRRWKRDQLDIQGGPDRPASGDPERRNGGFALKHTR